MTTTVALYLKVTDRHWLSADKPMVAIINHIVFHLWTHGLVVRDQTHSLCLHSILYRQTSVTIITTLHIWITTIIIIVDMVIITIITIIIMNHTTIQTNRSKCMVFQWVGENAWDGQMTILLCLQNCHSNVSRWRIGVTCTFFLTMENIWQQETAIIWA